MDKKDQTGTCEVMVFRPTMEEFKDFPKYIEHIEKCGAHLKSGVAKIIPPPEWSPRPVRGHKYDDIGDIMIDEPISQTVEGERGCYTQFNTLFKKQIPVRDFEKLAKSARYAVPQIFQTTADMERYYWKNVTYGKPVYGADFHASLYDVDEVKYWNINHLPSILDILNEEGMCEISGVNNAYMYFGMWKATFPWHTEDMDLYSINYIHYGAPKFWYGISHQHKEKFERLAALLFPQSAACCKAFLRHKTHLISPTLLKTHNIPYGTILHKAGEIMITFPGGHHAGFNCGYNAAESTNFASDRWIDFGKIATICRCRPDTVRINMSPFIQRFRPKEWPEWKYWYVDEVEPSERWPEKGIKSKVSSTVSKRQALAKKKSPKKPQKRSCLSFHPDVPKSLKLDGSGPCCSSDLVKEDEEEIQPVLQKHLELLREDRSPSPVIWECQQQNVPQLKQYRNLWQWKAYNLMAEREFNSRLALVEPHCAICQYFVPKSLCRKAKMIPSHSRRLISELCYNRDPLTPSKQMKEGTTEPERLLTCTHCKVTVHASCYGETRWEHIGDEDDDTNERPMWECCRCNTPGAEKRECMFCNLRGGALQRTSDNSFAHIICALFNYDRIEWVDLNTKRPIRLKYFDGVDEDLPDCLFCEGDKGLVVMCQHSECTPNFFHVTCGRLAGASFELRDFPQVLAAVCPNHDDLSEVEGLSNLKEGDEVIAWLDSGANVQRGQVKKVRLDTFCVVDFDDGSFSTDLYADDIVKCSCEKNGCQGAHSSGSRVQVQWPDGDGYWGIFRRAYHAKTYQVQLENGQMSDVTRIDLYGPKEVVPNIVLERLNQKPVKEEEAK